MTANVPDLASTDRSVGKTPRRWAPVLAAPLLVGVLVGTGTSWGQAVVDLPWLVLVNSASPWLAAAFAVGAAQRGWLGSVVSAVLTGVIAVAAYYVTASLRGYGVSTSYVALWLGCATIGGPVFGAAAQAWRRGTPRGLGAALLPAAFLAEGLNYELALGYTGSAAIFVVVGLLLAVVLGRQDPLRTLLWLAPCTVLGMAGFAGLAAVVG